MPRIEFTRNQAFILEDSNLQRMLDIVHASFGQSPYEIAFSVTLSGGKSLQFSSASDLLKHDNTVADPVHHLKVIAAGSSTTSSCTIFFFGERHPNLSGINVEVKSDEQRWANSLAAELEEQIERIKMPGILYQLRQSVVFRNLLTTLLIPLVFAASTLGLFMDHSKLSGALDERRALLQLSEAAKSIEEKVDFLVRAQVSALREKGSATIASAIKVPKLDAKLAVGLLPILISLALAWYLLRYCYPPAVFSWGDSGKHFQRLTERRKNLWSIVITVIVLGFLVNLSSPIISSWLGV